MTKPFMLSRKFIIAIAFLAVQAITFFTPDDIDRKIEAFAPYVTLVAVAAITGVTIEDSAKAWAERPASTRDAIDAVLDETIPKTTPPNVTVNLHGVSATASPGGTTEGVG